MKESLGYSELLFFALFFCWGYFNMILKEISNE